MKRILLAVVVLVGLATVANADNRQFVVVGDNCSNVQQAVVVRQQVQRQFVVVGNAAPVQRQFVVVGNAVPVQRVVVGNAAPARVVVNNGGFNRQQVVVNNGGFNRQQVVVNQGRQGLQGLLQRLTGRNDSVVVNQRGNVQRIIVK